MSLRSAILLSLFLAICAPSIDANAKAKSKKTSIKKTSTKRSSAKKTSTKRTIQKNNILVQVPRSAEKQKEDPSIRALTLCGDSTGCLLVESIVLAPIFPWFLYPFDSPATKYQSRRFNDVSGVLDFGLMKANKSYSGYKVGLGAYIKWVGLELMYDTYNNGEFDQNYYSAYFVIRPFPRKHVQPKLLIGLKYIKTDRVSGSGLSISFFNYDIAFTRRLWMHVINYIGWVKGYTLVEGLLGLEYYVYPTISIKTSMDIRHIASEYLYGFNVGLSIKI